MKILGKYIHGSEDSIDTNVYYLVDEVPSFAESKKFCDSIVGENANLISIKDYRVNACYKGTIDECNNSLLSTYHLHKQEYPRPNIIYIARDKNLKYIRAIRIILSHLSRTQYRREIKEALKSDKLLDKTTTLLGINFETIDFDNLSKNQSGKDVLKVIAFQIGQVLGLFKGIEFYTKSSISNDIVSLKPFLYRESNKEHLSTLDLYIYTVCTKINELIKFESDGIVIFNDGSKYDVLKEKRLN